MLPPESPSPFDFNWTPVQSMATTPPLVLVPMETRLQDAVGWALRISWAKWTSQAEEMGLGHLGPESGQRDIMYPIPTLGPQIWPLWWPSFLEASGALMQMQLLGPTLDPRHLSLWRKEPRNLPLKWYSLGTTEHGVLGEHYGVSSLTSIRQGSSSIFNHHHGHALC